MTLDQLQTFLPRFTREGRFTHTTVIITGLRQTVFQRGEEVILNDTNLEIFQPRERLISVFPADRIQQISVLA